MKNRLRLLAKSNPDKIVVIRFRAEHIDNQAIAADHKVSARAADAAALIYATENTWPVYCRDILVDGEYL